MVSAPAVERKPMNGRRRTFHALTLTLVAFAGCMSPGIMTENPTPLPEPQGGYEQVWNTTVRVVDKYFEIASENRYGGTIETLPETGATLLEPWRRDAVGFYERLEGTFQTVRRRCFVNVQPSPTGGFLVGVEVYKELENLPAPVYTNFGGGTLLQSIQPLQEQVLDTEVPPSMGWIAMGRDPKLEARIIADLKAEFGCYETTIANFQEAPGPIMGPSTTTVVPGPSR
jgi:hypothetical protein